MPSSVSTRRALRHDTCIQKRTAFDELMDSLLKDAKINMLEQDTSGVRSHELVPIYNPHSLKPLDLSIDTAECREYHIDKVSRNEAIRMEVKIYRIKYK